MPADGSRRPSVCILGAGVIGLSCAYNIMITKQLDCDVTILATSLNEKDTTSFGSAGLWKPNLIEGTSPEQVNKWGKYTFDFFMNLIHGQDSATAGISLMSAFHIFEENQICDEPTWKDIVINYQRLSKTALTQLQLPDKYTDGFTYSTITVEQAKYLAYLKHLLAEKSVKFINQYIDDLSVFLQNESSRSYDVIINCTGLGSARICQDDRMFPIRGQVVRVNAPWLKSCWFFGNSYIIPNISNVVLGGTADYNESDTSISDLVTFRIINNIAGIFPAIYNAPIENVWCGLRPARSSGVRLESQIFEGRQVIHCYGHGGCGVTLSMGCAIDVVENHLVPFLATLQS